MHKLLLHCVCLAALPSVAAAAEASYSPKAYVRAVLTASPAIRKAELAFEQAENSFRSALFDAALPAFSVSLSGSLYDDLDRRLRLEREELLSSLSAAWNLYDSASSPRNRIRTAKLDYEHAKLTFLAAKQTESLRALNRFYALYAARGRVGAAKANLASRERQYKDTNEQYQSGTRSRIEVMQSEGDKLQSELSLAQAESAEIKALMAFNELINAEPEAPAGVELSTAAAEVKLPLPPGDLARALNDNLSLRRQRLLLKKSRITSYNAVMADLPRLRVDAAWSKTALGLVGEPSGSWRGNPDYGIRASLNYAFGFLGAQKYLDIKNRSAALESAETDLQDSERALKTELLSAQKEIELQVKSRNLLEFQVKTQQESTGNLISEYSLGGASMLQLDTAQTKLLDSANGRIAAVNALDLALANYRALLGEKIWE